jgi:hypothetical protein
VRGRSCAFFSLLSTWVTPIGALPALHERCVGATVSQQARNATRDTLLTLAATDGAARRDGGGCQWRAHSVRGADTLEAGSFL